MNIKIPFQYTTKFVLLFVLLVTSIPSLTAKEKKKVNVLITYKGEWSNVLTRWKIPTVLRRAARKFDKKITRYRVHHKNFLRPRFYQSSFDEIQNNYFNFPDGARDFQGVIRAEFFDQYVNLNKMKEYLLNKKITHIVIPGGQAVSPFFYDQEAGEFDEDYLLWRDFKELSFLLVAREMGIPVLVICRGLQLANSFFGGTVNHRIMIDLAEPHQVDWNIHTNYKLFPLHHPLFIVNDSLMQKFYLPYNQSEDPILYSPWKVTSIHQHSLEKVSPHFRVTSFVPITFPADFKTNIFQDVDVKSPYVYREGFDVVESVEYKGSDFFLLGIQFHAEYLAKSARTLRLFGHFLNQ